MDSAVRKTFHVKHSEFGADTRAVRVFAEVIAAIQAVDAHAFDLARDKLLFAGPNLAAFVVFGLGLRADAEAHVFVAELRGEGVGIKKRYAHDTCGSLPR